MNRITAAVLAAFWLSAGAAYATSKTYDMPEETTTLRPGPGVEVAQANCLTCHSPDYIAMQPGGKGLAFWSAEVTKMVKVFGAPIRDEDAHAIAGYLAATY